MIPFLWVYGVGAVCTLIWVLRMVLDKGTPTDQDDVFWTVVLTVGFTVAWPITMGLWFYSWAVDAYRRSRNKERY